MKHASRVCCLCVAALGLAVGLLSCLSFIPAQWLLKSDSLQAMFQFGTHEVMAFLLLQLPLAAGLGAIYFAGAATGGFLFIQKAWRLVQDTNRATAMTCFHASLAKGA